MAVTQYQIFCRYLNENVNRALTNQTPKEWISAEEYESVSKFYTENKVEYENLKKQIIAGTIKESQFTVVQLNLYAKCKRYEAIQVLIKQEKSVVENCYIRPADGFYPSDTQGLLKKAASKLDQEKYQIIIDESNASNPKYDMVFMYDGITNHVGEPKKNPPTSDKTEPPYMYYERMKRIKLDPWFLYSTHVSLNSAMEKAKELVNLLGKDAVKIGKVVPLDQYIEIV